MTNFYTYSLTENDLTRQANIVKETLVGGLVAENYLTKEQGLEILRNYAIVVIKKGWLGKIMDKWRNLEDEPLYFKLVKEINRPNLLECMVEKTKEEDKQKSE